MAQSSSRVFPEYTAATLAHLFARSVNIRWPKREFAQPFDTLTPNELDHPVESHMRQPLMQQ